MGHAARTTIHWTKLPGLFGVLINRVLSLVISDLALCTKPHVLVLLQLCDTLRHAPTPTNWDAPGELPPPLIPGPVDQELSANVGVGHIAACKGRFRCLRRVGRPRGPFGVESCVGSFRAILACC